MATYYISTSGSDNNPGSISQPWFSLNHALAYINGGDTIYFRGGTHDTYIHALTPVPSGTASNPTIIAGYPGETVTWQMTDSNSTAMTLGEQSLVQYVTFRNLIFDCINESGPYSDGIRIGGYGGTGHITIEDFVLKNTWASGIHADTNDCIYRRGVLHTIGRKSSPGGPGAGHGFYTTGTNNLHENLEIYNVISGYGIQIQYENANFNTINACIIHDNAGGGIVLSSHHNEGVPIAGHNNVVTNTICYRNNGGISCGGGGDEIVRNNRVYNNTCYNNISNGFRMGLAENCLITNNISFGNEVDFKSDSGSLYSTNTFQNNNWMAANAVPIYGTDPGLVDPANGDFHLRNGSPSIGAGIDLSSTFNTDYDGQTRTVPWDIGAYRFGAGGTPPPPPVAGTTKHVALSGSDDNPGTLSLPFRTIAHATSRMDPGDLLYIRGGTWDERIHPFYLTIPSGLGNSQRTIIAAYPGETVWLSPSEVVERGVLSAFSNSYITFQDIHVDGTNCGSTEASDPGENSTYIRYLRCEIKNAGGNGMWIGASFTEVLSCNIHHNGGNSIHLASSDSLVESCTLHDSSGYGLLQYSPDSSDRNNNIIRYNRIYNNGFDLGKGGLLVSSGQNVLVHNNVVYDNFSDGISLATS